MWRYLKAAFLVGADVPALGRVPVNVLASAGFFILGFGHPGFWFLGLAAEAALLPALAFNQRFQNYVDATERQLTNGDSQVKRTALVQTLPPEDRKHIEALDRKCAKVLDVYRNAQAEEFLVETNREALDNLKWVYTKLLIARFHLLTAGTDDTAESLDRKIVSLEHDLHDTQETPALRQSKGATLDILKRRLSSVGAMHQAAIRGLAAASIPCSLKKWAAVRIGEASSGSWLPVARI